MDFTKFKIVPIFLIAFFNVHVAFGQFDIPIYITTSHENSAIPIRISPNSRVDQIYERIDSVYRFGYGGYNRLLVGNEVFLIHLEEYDDFNAAVFNNNSKTTIIYSGAQGALKNEFLFSRDKAFNDFSTKDSLLQQSGEALKNSVDSLVTDWSKKIEGMPFSELFKEDEKMYYKCFSSYLKLVHKQYEQENTVNLYNIELDQFPKMDYLNPRYLTTIPPYKALAEAYNFKKVLSMENVSQARKFLNRSSGFLNSKLKDKAFALSTEHHPRAKFLYRISKPKYNPHSLRERKLYRKSKQNGVGDDFTFPKATSVDNSIVNFTNFENKKVYLLIYDFGDTSLAKNLSKWNKFVLEQDIKSYYVAYALNGESNQDIWQRLQFSSQVAGLNVKSNLKDGFAFVSDLGIQLLPRVIAIAADGTIANPNVDLNFLKRGFDRPNFTIQQ